MSYKNAAISLNMDKFNEFVQSTPRYYSILVMLIVVLAQVQCEACCPANSEFFAIVKSWRLVAALQ